MTVPDIVCPDDRTFSTDVDQPHRSCVNLTDPAQAAIGSEPDRISGDPFPGYVTVTVTDLDDASGIAGVCWARERGVRPLYLFLSYLSIYYDLDLHVPGSKSTCRSLFVHSRCL